MSDRKVNDQIVIQRVAHCPDTRERRWTLQVSEDTHRAFKAVAAETGLTLLEIAALAISELRKRLVVKDVPNKGRSDE